MFEIINKTRRKIQETDELKEYINYIVKKEKLENCEFNIIIINDKKIRKINKEYRFIDKKTDVISFALEDNDNIKFDGFRILGDIYISIDRTYAQAKLYKHSSLRELCFLATHGILHLLGYDHMNPSDEKIMFNKQEKLLKSYGITRSGVVQ